MTRHGDNQTLSSVMECPSFFVSSHCPEGIMLHGEARGTCVLSVVGEEGKETTTPLREGSLGAAGWREGSFGSSLELLSNPSGINCNCLSCPSMSNSLLRW